MCLCNLWYAQTSAQLQENAIPLSDVENLPALTHFKELSFADSSFCMNMAGSVHRLAKQNKFACPIDTDLDPGNAGEWTKTPGGRVWRLGIRSENAYSLYVSMRFLLPPGVKLFVYAPGYRDLRGAFTSRNNNPAEILSIAPIRGDRIVIELNQPSSMQEFGIIRITKVYHDYYNIFKDPAFPGLKSSMACDEDINCANGRYWQTEKRSVCKIISNGGMGTGTLVGNTSGSSTPYLLTAYHLISTAEIAAGAIFLFNNETTDCQENITTSVQSISGASLVATTEHQLDFALLKLSGKPPPSFQPFYAGWDARNIISQKEVCIHHPFGNYKQIAIDYHPVKIEDIGEGFDANSTWKISHWEAGTTEMGSSGAPLFNEQHRVIGTLTGGRSTCGYPMDDYFTRIGVAWDTYPDPSNQLKYWLDSAQTGNLVSDGYDPYGFTSEFCDTVWNFFSDDKLGLSNEGLTWGWISGHSPAGYTHFAERYDSPGPLHLSGVYLHVAKAYAAEPLANIEVKVWDGNQYPEKECYTKLLFFRDLQPEKVNYIAFDSVLKTSGPFFAGYKINYNTVSDTFALYHVLDRGYTKASSMYLYHNGWYRAKEPEAFGIATSLALGISACYGRSSVPVADMLNVYPNPCVKRLTIDIPGGMSVHELICYDANGRRMPVSLRQTEEANTLYFNLRQGIYFLKILTEEKIFTARFIVIAE
jgi:hypothetical protein